MSRPAAALLLVPSRRSGRCRRRSPRVVWITRDDTPRVQFSVWTLRGGAPTKVTTVTDTDVSAPEVGTATDGVPLVAFANGGDEVRLVRLDTGAVRSFSFRRHGHSVGGVAIDNGRIYYTLVPTKAGSQRRSSLWRASITGAKPGRAVKIRTSGREKEGWLSVLADRNRVAVDTVRPLPKAVHGPGYPTRRVRLGFDNGLGFGNVSLISRSGRFLAVGPDANGTLSVGFTGVAFPPG